MSKTALFPGSFDPFTIGHLHLVEKASRLFDRVVVAVGVNVAKRPFQPLEQRIELISRAVSRFDNVDVRTYSSLTTDFCREVGANYIIRGVRDTADYEYERRIADINRRLAPDIETVFLLPDPDHAIVSSTLVRELSAFGKDTTPFVP